MPAIHLPIEAWSGWSPGCAPPEENTPSLLRRRVTPMGRKALSAAWNLPHAADARFIYSSRHGEFERTLSLMKEVLAETDLSPADFTLSVHHALIGLLSIAQKNRKGHTAIAAGPESFCFGLIEAAACLVENPDEHVILIHCDTPLLAPYDTFNTPQDAPVVVALALNAGQTSNLFDMSQNPASGSDENGNHALAFLDFISGNASECVSRGAERGWHWKRHAAA